MEIASYVAEFRQTCRVNLACRGTYFGQLYGPTFLNTFSSRIPSQYVPRLIRHAENGGKLDALRRLDSSYCYPAISPLHFRYLAQASYPGRLTSLNIRVESDDVGDLLVAVYLLSSQLREFGVSSRSQEQVESCRKLLVGNFPALERMSVDLPYARDLQLPNAPNLRILECKNYLGSEIETTWPSFAYSSIREHC